MVQSHIHLGKNHVAGGVMVFFCSNNNVPNVQPCPADGGTVTGTITAANVLAIATQNVTAGDFDALTEALSSNTAYANIHTMKFPAGEIRGQIHRAERRSTTGMTMIMIMITTTIERNRQGRPGNDGQG